MQCEMGVCVGWGVCEGGEQDVEGEYRESMNEWWET